MNTFVTCSYVTVKDSWDLAVETFTMWELFSSFLCSEIVEGVHFDVLKIE